MATIKLSDYVPVESKMTFTEHFEGVQLQTAILKLTNIFFVQIGAYPEKLKNVTVTLLDGTRWQCGEVDDIDCCCVGAMSYQYDPDYGKLYLPQWVDAVEVTYELPVKLVPMLIPNNDLQDQLSANKTINTSKYFSSSEWIKADLEYAEQMNKKMLELLRAPSLKQEAKIIEAKEEKTASNTRFSRAACIILPEDEDEE